MSEEREILKKILLLYRKDNSCMSWGVARDIEYLLAQPEQEEAPVATKLEGHQFTAFHVSADDFKKLKKLPTGTRLYTAPPKREPFVPEERQRLSKAYSTRAEQVAFEEGIIFAKILYGIGGEPLSNEQKRLGAIAIKQREAHGIGGGE